MSKKLKTIFIILLIFTMLPSVKIFASNSIKIYVDDQLLKLSADPVIENGTTLVPMRDIFERLGLSVMWNDKTKTATGVNAQYEIKLTIGSKIAYVNGVKKELTLAPKIINGRTMVPLRFISEAVGCQVIWIGETKTIKIYSYSVSTYGQLYAVPGSGKYADYMMLKGYEGEDKFQIYFQGDSNSFMTTVEDLRNINLNEVITWQYNGVYYKSTRKELYSFFSDSSKLRSLLGTSSGEVFSSNWFKSTFGQVYLDWLEGMQFSAEASNLVTEYFIQTGQSSNSRDILLTPDAEFEYIDPDEEDEEEYMKELQERIKRLLESGKAVEGD